MQLFAQNMTDPNRPLIKLDVFIDGRKYQINDGDTLKADSKTIIIKTSDYLTFNFEALSFEYPKHFSYEFEKDESYKNWTLDGNAFVITYFVFDMPVELDDFVSEMTDKFGKKNCSVMDKNSKLGTIQLSGKRINVNLIGTKLTYDMYRLITSDGKTHLLAFQDSKNDDGSDSAEGIQTIKIINETIKQK
jgi:hypothetical protein